ncbi:MAG: Type fimbrial biosis protein PilY1, partial [Herminiimonas sp.]|nr:Type fimbrial biosis protein PilY1 [Herminiimonas sp.]
TCTGPIISPSTTPNDLCTNNVPSNGLDVATTQHMTTFTLGLGAQGQMVYSPTHATDSSGDFYDIKMGTTANSTAGICSWQTGGACNWPTPSSDSIANIDDLWHAAINGRGSYFSASEPESLSSGLTKTLQTIINTPRPGTAAAAASSNPNISSSDNYVFSSSYKSVEWYGELIRQQIDANSALTEPQWSAMRLLDCATTPWTAATTYAPGSNYANGGVCYTVTTAYSSGAAFGSTDTDNTAVVPGTPSTRTIYTKGASGLIPFQWGNLSATQQGYFTKPAVAGLSQFCATGGTCLTTTEQNNNTIATGGAAGEALVNFLRGDRSNEERYFRKRFHVLGDIVSSEARYVKTPLFRYADPGYSAYRTAQVNRAGMVYVGANDGMLHAFSAETGQEAWAYIPEAVLPQIHKLADKTYSANHQYFVDNSPDVGDICPSAPASACSGTQWKTILVGGLNRGGKSYYALDVTNPAAPALLWEFTNAELGYSYGNPKITKLKNGTWVVLLTSGYNNTDGSGRLYVLNAYTGALIRTIVTGAGSAASPSGLARISAHALEPMIDNTTVAVYGGDLLGNLWRFDINGDIGAAGHEAHLLATFRDASGNLQPITSKPLEATINGKTVVYVGTGRYLGTTDVSDSRLQSFYAVMDRRDTTTHSNPRATGSGFVAQSLSAGACPQGAAVTVCSAGQTVRTSSNNAVNWATASGFYVDFLNGGERASSDATLGLGTLLFTTITPRATSVSACGAEGPDNSASFVYALDYLTGGAVVGSNNVVGVSLGSGMVTRPILVAQSDGTVRALIRASAGGGGGIDLGGTLIRTPPIKPPSGGGTRRVSWRELVD